METKSTWLPLNQRAYEDDEVKDLQGMRVHMVVSPYDVPEALRLLADEAKKLLRVEFKYMSHEPTDCRDLGASTFAELGRNSKRLYAIELKDDNGELLQAVSRVEEAFKRLMSST
jgi:hypothetical protein